MTPAIELPPPRDRAEFKRRIREERGERRRAARIVFYTTCYTGMLRVVQFPAYALDLLDRYGKPDHSKMGPFLVSQELIAICAYDVIKNNHTLQPFIVLIIAVLSFASGSLMRYFLDKNKSEVTASSVVNLAVEHKTQVTEETKRIIEERRSEDGVPPRSMPPAGAQVPE